MHILKKDFFPNEIIAYRINTGSKDTYLLNTTIPCRNIINIQTAGDLYYSFSFRYCPV